LPFSLKLLITGLLLGTALAYAAAIIYTHTKIGGSYASIITYYRGSEQGMDFPLEFTELIGLTHLHLFNLSLLSFLLGLIFLQTSTRESLKSGAIALAFISVFLYCASGWLIRYIGPEFAWVLIASNIGLGFTFSLFLLVPLLELWLPEPLLHQILPRFIWEK